MYKSRIIGPEEALAVFGVVRLCYPDIQMESWRSHVSELARAKKRDDAGCLVIQDWRKCAHAACLFRVAPDPRVGKRLEVSYVAKADLPASGAVSALLIAINELAAERGCEMVVIQDFNARAFPEDRVLGVSPAETLAALGYQPAPMGFVRGVGVARRAEPVDAR